MWYLVAAFVICWGGAALAIWILVLRHDEIDDLQQELLAKFHSEKPLMSLAYEIKDGEHFIVLRRSSTRMRIPTEVWNDLRVYPAAARGLRQWKPEQLKQASQRLAEKGNMLLSIHPDGVGWTIQIFQPHK